MILNFAAWQVTFLMLDFSLETTWSIYCFTDVSRTVGWVVAAPCDAFPCGHPQGNTLSDINITREDIIDAIKTISQNIRRP